MTNVARYVIVFDSASVDLGGFTEVIRPSAVDRALRTDEEIVALVNHNSMKPLGRRSANTLTLAKDSFGLRATIAADEEVSFVADAIRLIQRRDAAGSSFAFVALDDAWSLVDDEPRREVLDMAIREVSIAVPFPAYQSTQRDAGDTSENRIILSAGRPMSIAMAERLLRQWRTR